MLDPPCQDTRAVAFVQPNDIAFSGERKRVRCNECVSCSAPLVGPPPSFANEDALEFVEQFADDISRGNSARVALNGGVHPSQGECGRDSVNLNLLWFSTLIERFFNATGLRLLWHAEISEQTAGCLDDLEPKCGR
jgi:hypothetical protein